MKKKIYNKVTSVRNAFLSVLLSASMVVSGVVVATPSVSQAADTAGEVKWVMSQEGKYMQDKGTLTTTAWDANNHSELYIDVDENITYQEMAQNIWGGCFNERGWHKLMQLTEEERNHILDLLFDPDEPEGLHLTMARMPIASSDYAMDMYSFDEVEDDYELEHFSIERDKEKLIPYIKAALERQPNLKIWASPWSPPWWMKQNADGSRRTEKNGGFIDYTDANMKTYAQYFKKFIEAYDAEGIEIYMVSPQNEPTMNTPYSSCVWTGEQLRGFIRDYLGPEMQKLGVQIYLGTFTNSDDSRVAPTLTDNDARKYISGITYQWWSYNKARSLYHTGFNQGMMQSETMCGDGNNNWQYAEYQFDEMYMYFTNGISAYTMWNMVLEWDGVNPGGDNTATNPWHQNAPITVNENTKKYTINPHFYEIKHYSDAVKANARRIESGGTYDMPYQPSQNSDKEWDSVYSSELREIAFRNVDGTISLLVKNGSSQDKKVDINFNGRKISVTVPAHSINTFTTQGTPLTGNETDMRGVISQDEIVTIKNVGSGQVFCIDGGGTASLSDIISWDYSGQLNQQWYLQPDKVNGQDTVKMVNMKSFSVAAINGGTSNVGERLILWPDTGEENQHWFMEKSGEYYKFKHTNGLYLTMAGEEKGSKAVQMEANDSNLQLWQVEPAYVSDGNPEVTAVSVTPEAPEMAKGETQQFTAEVAGNNNAPGTVNWTIDGNKSSATKISRNGLLTVAADETAEKITVRATSTWDITKSKKVTVTVRGNEAPKVASVSVSPKTASVKAGETKQFQAQVVASGGAPSTVNWSVSGNASSQTKISSTGLLAVAADETAAKLTVKAESASDKTKYDMAEVTVTKAAEAAKLVPGKNTTHKVGTLYYKVTKSASANGTVTVTKPVKNTYTSVNIPATVDIDGYTFKVTAIGNKAFYKNAKLKKVTIGNNVTKIGTSAFASDKKLTTVTLGTRVTTIESKAFYKDAKLKTVSIKSKKLKTVKKQAFKGIAGKAKVSVPKSKAKSYKKLLKKAGLPAKASVK